MDIYTELIKTLVYISFQCQLCYYHTSCRIENSLGNVWVYKHAKQCFDLQVHINEKKTSRHFIQLKGNAYFWSIFKL